MGLIDSLRSFARSSQKTVQEASTKTPNFVVTNLNSHNPFASLTEERFNYYDQMILYTGKSIDYISDKVASTELYMFDGNDEIEKNDILEDFLAFNPFMTLWEGRKLIETHKRLVGAAYLFIDRQPELNKRFELYPLDPTKMKVATDKLGLPRTYQYTDADGKIVTLDPNDVVYYRRLNPKNWFEGKSQVEDIEYLSNAFKAGAQFNMNTFFNGGRPDVLMVFQDISEEEQLRAEAALRERYGGTKNANKIGILSDKPEIIDLARNNRDLQYVDGMKMLRQDILAMFGIPEALMFPSATNSNSKEAVRLFQEDTLLPALQNERATLNEQLLRKLGVEGVTIEFRNPVKADQNELYDQAAKATNAGFFTVNQALEHIGEDPVEDGDRYTSSTPSEPVRPDEEPALEDEDMDAQEDEIKSLKQKTIDLEKAINDLMEAKYRKEFKKKAAKQTIDQEGIMYETATQLFSEQATRAIKYINESDPTIRGIFNLKSEIKATEEVFSTAYTEVVQNTNQEANVEIKSKMMRYHLPQVSTFKGKAVTTEGMKDINDRLERFANEISGTTRDKLRKIIADGVEAGFDKTQFRQAILNAFNEMMDGQKNINVLEKIGVYNEALSIVDDSVTVNSSVRYKSMFDEINAAEARGDITKGEQREALKALKGMLDPADGVAQDVNAILKTLFNITDNTEGISYSRATTIARTEATFARNLSLRDTYSDNEFVKSMEWNSAFDKDTRDAHRNADGQTVEKGEVFKVDGEELKFPGDTSLGASAGNVINCRCRITANVI